MIISVPTASVTNADCIFIPLSYNHLLLSPSRNSVPQNPSFPSSERDRLLSDVSELFRVNFPYTTVYPALGNLDFFPNPEAAARSKAFSYRRASKGRARKKAKGKLRP